MVDPFFQRDLKAPFGLVDQIGGEIFFGQCAEQELVVPPPIFNESFSVGAYSNSSFPRNGLLPSREWAMVAISIFTRRSLKDWYQNPYS